MVFHFLRLVFNFFSFPLSDLASSLWKSGVQEHKITSVRISITKAVNEHNSESVLSVYRKSEQTRIQLWSPINSIFIVVQFIYLFVFVCIVVLKLHSSKLNSCKGTPFVLERRHTHMLMHLMWLNGQIAYIEVRLRRFYDDLKPNSRFFVGDMAWLTLETQRPSKSHRNWFWPSQSVFYFERWFINCEYKEETPQHRTKETFLSLEIIFTWLTTHCSKNFINIFRSYLNNEILDTIYERKIINNQCYSIPDTC